MRAIAGEGDLATLMAPDESLARERSSLSKRIADLKKADALIERRRGTTACPGSLISPSQKGSA